jgi:hypothetical protein
MRRIQFIELHEQTWFPASLRDEITDVLQFGLNLTNVYANAVMLLQDALRSTGSHFVVDLCSGAGGPWLGLHRKLQENAWALQICLTDKYPNLHAFDSVSRASDDFTLYPESVDATAVPSEIKGFRTMFTSFHHFPRKEALAILQSSIDAGQSIGIFEITRRSLLTIALMYLWALTPFLFTPFIRPFRWSGLFWTYVVPVIPFVLLFDGVVSCLRTYRPSELWEMTEELSGNDYQWETGEHPGALSRVPITYLIGHPRTQSV